MYCQVIVDRMTHSVVYGSKPQQSVNQGPWSKNADHLEMSWIQVTAFK